MLSGRAVFKEEMLEVKSSEPGEAWLPTLTKSA